MKYMVVIEKGVASYGAHVPDLPGCIAVGQSREDVLGLIREGIELHIEGLKEAGEPVRCLHPLANTLASMLHDNSRHFLSSKSLLPQNLPRPSHS